MKFQVSTTPLNDGLALGVVNANVSNYYKRSCIAQITATKNELHINLEASRILSEIRLKGSGDSDESVTTFVSSLLLKQLVSTFSLPITTLEFVNGGLVLHSGKSTFTLPKMDIDASATSLRCPDMPEYTAEEINVDKSDWKFIKNNQMYAIAMSFAHPVYTKVWVGDHGDVLVGDFDIGLFTHSDKCKLGTTCLLSDTIVNLFNSLPEGAKLVKVDKDYIVKVTTDGFEFISQFSPEYESDENVGSYNSEIIINMMTHDEENAVKVPSGVINKFLNQADLLASGSESTITLHVENNEMMLKDTNVDCRIDLDIVCRSPYEVEFKTSLLKSVLSSYTDETISISPMMQGDEVAGIKVWNKELTTVLAGVD